VYSTGTAAIDTRINKSADRCYNSAMPTYDFQCQHCGGLFEHRLSMADYSERRLPTCPECGAASPTPLLSSSMTILTSRDPRPDQGSPGSSGSCGGGSCGCSCG